MTVDHPAACVRRTAFRPHILSTRSTAPPIRASMRSAATAPSASCRPSTIWCSSAPPSRAIRWKAIARVRHRRRCWARASPRSRSSSKIPITIAGMSFGALGANAKEALGRAATAHGHHDHHRRRRHDPGRAPVLEDAGLSVPALALRLQSRRSAPGRRHRGRDRAGRQARRRRHAAGPEDQPRASPRCATCPRASISVSACRHPDWTGPDDLTIKIQELREITDWRDADLREDRRHARTR